MQFDVATAILAGDALLTEAFLIIAQAYRENPAIAVALTAELADAAGSRRLIAGQCEDIRAESEPIESDDLEFIHRNKTAALLSAVPKPDPRLRSQRVPLRGEVANPAAPPSGCYFHPRCLYAIDVCKTDPPPLEEIVPGQWAACHRARELQLAGIDQV